MTLFIACLIAGISTAAFLRLWFWVVRRELYAKQKSVEAAKCQLIAGKQLYLRVRDSSGEKKAQEIMDRSKSVYLQTVQLYNETLHRPRNIVPGKLMGFHSIILNDMEQ